MGHATLVCYIPVYDREHLRGMPISNPLTQRTIDKDTRTKALEPGVANIAKSSLTPEIFFLKLKLEREPSIISQLLPNDLNEQPPCAKSGHHLHLFSNSCMFDTSE